MPSITKTARIKEIRYIHAEGYPAGAMKHGPTALIGTDLPVVCIAVRDEVYERVLSDVEWVKWTSHGSWRRA